MARPINPSSRRQHQLRQSGGGTNFTPIPANGYTGPIPSWPLNTDPAQAELEMWGQAWRTPQATMWAMMSIERVVARYVMVSCLALEEPRAGTLAEVRHLEDRLGLSPASLQKLHWSIEDMEEGEDSRTSEQVAESEDRWAQIIGMDEHR